MLVRAFELLSLEDLPRNHSIREFSSFARVGSSFFSIYTLCVALSVEDYSASHLASTALIFLAYSA